MASFVKVHPTAHEEPEAKGLTTPARGPLPSFDHETRGPDTAGVVLVRQKGHLMPTITTHYRGDMLFESVFGNHSLTIDLPAEMGGSDRGPTPPEVFIASLGSCVGAFVATYCANTGIDAEGLTVDVSYDKADDPSRLVNLRVVVKLPKSEVGRREDALLRVAAHCPVHETIETVNSITFELLDASDL
jgi:uncharacterized OsmC-like protein